MRTEYFDAYVRLADNGANTWPRIIGTLVLAGMVAVAGSAALLAALWMAASAGWLGAGDLEAAMATPYGVVVSLLAIAVLWLGLPVGLRLLHRRSIASVIGHDGWAGRRDLVAGLIVGAAVPVVAALLTIPLGPVPERSGLGLGTWLLLFLPIAALILAQASAEEALFRGYLPQVLAARGHGALVWFALPTLLFSAMHWYDGVPLWKNLAVIAAIGIFAVGMMILVVRTGRLAAACGLHWGNNIVAVQLVSLDDGLGGTALYHLPPLADPAWTVVTLGAVVALAIPTTALQLALLLHPRSPLRVGSA